MNERFEMEWGGRRYSLSPQGFYDTRTFLRPPEAIHRHLKTKSAKHLETVCQRERNVPLLLEFSRLAKDLAELDLAEKITKQALSLAPRDPSAVARMAGILRAKGQPKEALEVIAHLPEKAQTPPLLTSRAAALCDLQLWSEADKVIERALGKLKGSSAIETAEASAILQRIRQAKGV